MAEEERKHDSTLRQDRLLLQQSQQLKRETSALTSSLDHDRERCAVLAKEKSQLEEALALVKSQVEKEQKVLDDIKQQVCSVVPCCL